MKYIFLSLSLSSVLANPFSGFGGFSGIDLDHDPRYRASREVVREEVSDCKILRFGEEYHLNKKNYQLEEVLTLLETTDSGAKLVNDIRSLIESGALSVRPFTSFERQRRELTSKVTALFDFTLATPTIFINFEDELGLVVNFFAHEAYHALDEKIPTEYEVDMVYFNAFKEMQKLFGLDKEPMKPLTEYESQKMSEIYELKERVRQNHVYRAEREAFDYQGVFTSEFTTTEDCSSSYLNEHRKKNKLKLHIKTPDSFIISSYGLNRDYLDQ